ncbi:MAG: amidophosphoribosyltransferase [Candidatus Omnitrophica bacterium]|nr:amidophosphoribosyltransferase [Candidatus Omnitrophota bacterium]
MSGIFGAVSQNNCSRTLLYGIDYHSHLGTEYGGMAVLGDNFQRQIHNISQSQFKSKFFDDHQRIKGNKGIGVISDLDEQPIYLNSKFGPFCIVTAGLIENKDELKEILFCKGISFSEVSPKGDINTTELIAKLISTGDNLVDGIERMFDMIQGSCSLLILNKDGVYAARDQWGYTPLVVGRKKDEWVVATESSSLLNLGFEIAKLLAPSEIILLTPKGIETRKKAADHMQICSFLWIYTGFPASSYEGINVEEVREKCGKALARKDNDIDIDVVAGVPDSGIAHAIGYSIESKKPYRRPLIKYTPGYGRSYTPPNQETRDLVARMKLIVINSIIKGNSLAVLDDSIVRGTQFKNYTVKKLWNAQAKEIHIRPACPPLMFPCKFCLSTRSIDELAARKAIRALEGKNIDDVSEYLDPSSEKYQKMIEWIKNDLNVTTLRYQTIDDMVEAIGLPKEKLCLYCWTGDCPGEKAHRKQKEEDATFSAK